MNFIKCSLPGLVVLLWLAFIGLGVWQHVKRTEQPPIYDALSYAQKAKNFWDYFEKGQFENPFNLDPTVRPPGTVLMSYPFGFKKDPRGFYFRSVFLPIIFFASGIFVVLHSRGMSSSKKWNVALVSIFLTTLPLFYHFELSKHPISPAHWGMVDAFLAGLSTLATAGWVRSIRYSSLGWLILAILLAGFCILIKPAGGLIMILVGLSWMIGVIFQIKSIGRTKIDQRKFKRFLFFGLIAMWIIYAVVLFACFSSKYLSRENISFYRLATAVLNSESKSHVTINYVNRLIHVSFGDLLPLVVTATGLLTIIYWKRLVFAPAESNKALIRPVIVCALLYLSVGIWFWIAVTGVSQVRYFFPFALMAITCALPIAMQVIEKIPYWGILSFRILCIIPAVNLALLLVQPHPPMEWQRVTGVNLSTGTYKEEIKHAKDLINKVGNEGDDCSLYSFYSGPAVFVFENVLRYEALIAPWKPCLEIRLPVTWQSPTTYHLGEIFNSDYILFEPVHILSDKINALSQKSIQNFFNESLLMHAWFTDLKEKDGIIVVSETPSLRLLKVEDRARLEVCLKELKERYSWRSAFSEANSKSSIREGRVRSRMAISLNKAIEIVGATEPQYRRITFGDRFILLGQNVVKTKDGLQIQLVWKSMTEQNLSFAVAVHLVDDKGNILSQLDYAQDRVRSFVEAGAQWLDKIDIPNSRLENVVSAAIGIYSVPGIKLLPVDKGPTDWNGRRLLICLPKI